MKSNISIRPARSEDATLLAAAEREIAKVPGRLASLPAELHDQDFKDTIDALSASERGIYAVIERDGVVAGHALLEPLKLAATAHVVSLTIAIHEGFQGVGLGRRLMEHLIEWARKSPKVEKIELRVRCSNTPAISLYEKLGFVEEGRMVMRIKTSEGQYLDDIIMGLWVG
jgi:ribosomal protein S18 acetylase RimI-like enzyme